MFLTFLKEKHKALWGLLLLKALGCLFLILFSPLHLSPDEAQYWAWGQALDWGYYSKPPGIAWQLALTSKIFGSTELGVRAGALIFGTLLPWILFRAMKHARFSDTSAFWAAVAFAFSPVGIFFTFAAVTDVGMTFFFTCALLVFGVSLQKQETPNYLLIGLLIGCGALFKWLALLAWLWIFLFFFFFPKVRSRTIVYGCLLSLVAFFPSLYWNITHEWATFRHVGSTIVTPTNRGWMGNPGDFLAAQIALFSPFFFILWVGGLFQIGTTFFRSARFFRLCAAISGTLLVYLGCAFFKKIQPNWADYLIPLAFPIVSWWAFEKGKGGNSF